MSDSESLRKYRKSLLIRMLAGVGATVLTFVVCAGFAIFLLIQRNTPPAVWQNPPLYPGAQDVRVADFGEEGIMQSKDGHGLGVFTTKIITYTVEASKADVISFYSNVISAGGMTPSVGGRFTTGAKDLNVSWTNHARIPSEYFLDLSNRAADLSHLEVEIGVSRFPGY